MASPSSLVPQFGIGFIVCLLVFCDFTLSHSATPRYDSIISFGDSTTDTGNALLSHPGIYGMVSKLPYGKTFFQRPTGRFSDGRLAVDFIAQAFGLPSPPPYLGGRSKDFRRGVNFAVGSATALDATFFPLEIRKQKYINETLNLQLKWFEQLKPSLCRSQPDCRRYFAKTFFLLGSIGMNDYGYLFFTGASEDKQKALVPSVVGAISSATERLIKHGAVELLVPGHLPIGCMPGILTAVSSLDKRDYDPKNGCLKEINAFSEFHNSLLRRALAKLQKKYPKARITYADYYGPTLAFASSPKRFGFSSGALRSCCGGGGRYNFNKSAFCGSPGSKVLGDSSTFVSWDGYHLTDAANRILAGTWVKQLA